MYRKLLFALIAVPDLPAKLHSVLADPAAALLLLAIGVLGICAELSLRSFIVPGVAGAACIVLSLNALIAEPEGGRGLVLLGASLGLLAVSAYQNSPLLPGMIAAAAMLAGVRIVAPGMNPAAAIAGSVAFSLLIGFLLSVAAAARRAKRSATGLAAKRDTTPAILNK